MINLIKAVFGLILLAGPVYAGYQQYSVKLLAVLALIFSFAKLIEKGELGVLLSAMVGRQRPTLSVSQAWLLFVVSYLVQILVVVIFYFLAYGVSSSLGVVPGEENWMIPIGCGLTGLVAGFLIYRDSLDEYFYDDSSGTSPGHLMDRLVSLSDVQVIMPVEIFSLAREMVEYPDREVIGALLEEGYKEFGFNKFQLRVFFTYIRFLDGADAYIEDLEEKILSGLEHESKWVAYDAAWAYQTLEKSDVIDSKIDALIKEYPVRDYEVEAVTKFASKLLETQQSKQL